MTYDSPKTLRRRQQQAEKPRRATQARKIKVMTDERWSAVCDFHIAYLRDRIEGDNADSAGRHAAALVHMAIQRRAQQIMIEKGILAFWTAEEIARHELLNGEAA